MITPPLGAFAVDRPLVAPRQRRRVAERHQLGRRQPAVAPRIGGRANGARGSRRGAMSRSRQRRKAASLPPSASSTALRARFSASPSSSSSAISVLRFLKPLGRPFGLPDRPLLKGRPAPL